MIISAGGLPSPSVRINVSDTCVGQMEENILEMSESVVDKDAASNPSSQEIASVYDSISSTVVVSLMHCNFKTSPDTRCRL